MAGPFVPNIMPVKATYHYDDITSMWKVTASRQIDTPSGGVKREKTQQEFAIYADAVSFVSTFFGNR